MFSALLGSGATHHQPKSSSQVSAAWAGWQQSGLCPLHPRARLPLPRSQQPSRGVLCSPGTAGSQVIARTLQKSLESVKLCSVAPAVASSHPLRVCRPAAVRGAVPLPTAGRGQPSATSVTLPAAPGKAGQESLSIQTFLPIRSQPAVFPWYSSNICLLLLLNIVFIILVLTLP